jgi:hypothetical protein
MVYRKERYDYKKHLKDYSNKMITVRVPKDLLDQMSRYRRLEGVSVTFQMCKGAEMYLKEKKAWSNNND